MSYADRRDAIVARLLSVPERGVVLDYRKAVTTWTDFKAAFTSAIGGRQVLRGWTVAWESGTLEPNGWAPPGDRIRMTGDQVFVVRGYMGHNAQEATDRTFSALVDAVMLALSTSAAALEVRQSHVPVSVRQNGFVELDAPGVGAVLCHYAEIGLRIRDERVV